MKKMKQIGWMMAVLAMTVVSCTQEEGVEQPVVPTDGYIYFNSEINSRGTLVTDMEGKPFSVTAFNYTGDWNTVKVKAAPNVFHDQLVEWEENKHTYDTDATTDGNQLKKWEGGKKYTFFAHYPHVNENSSVSISESDTEGVPYITYTLEPSNMVDVMTASLFDTDNTATNAVGLTFKHRLVAMDIQARNLIDPVIIDGMETPVYIKLTALTMEFTNQKYNLAKIWLDEEMGMEISAAAGWNTTQSYTMIPAGEVILKPMGDASDEDASVNVSSDKGTTLIFLPQEGTNASDCLQGEVSFTYKYVKQDGTEFNDNELKDEQGNNIEPQTGPISFTTGKEMVAGRKYAFQMNFSRTMVTIGIVEQGEWTDKDIEIEFE